MTYLVKDVFNIHIHFVIVPPNPQFSSHSAQFDNIKSDLLALLYRAPEVKKYGIIRDTGYIIV